MNLYAIAAKAEADIKTVRKWLDPERRKSMKPSAARRVAKAAAELGYHEPPALQEAS
jgi:DNA-binding LacI/PurR family transcriptional regulator